MLLIAICVPAVGTALAGSAARDGVSALQEIPNFGLPDVASKGDGREEVTLTREVKTYEQWAFKIFSTEELLIGLASPESDPDGDGCSNLREYVANGNPLLKDAEKCSYLLRPTLTNAGMRYVARLEKIRPDVSITLEHSTDLEHWNSDDVVAETKVADGIQFRIDLNPAPASRFVRIHFELKPLEAVELVTEIKPLEREFAIKIRPGLLLP